MSKLNVAYVNKETGEELDGMVVYHQKPVENEFERFAMLNQNFLLRAAGELELNEIKVLAICVGLSEYNNRVMVTQKYIAEVGHMYKSTVSKAMKGLIEKGYIQRVQDQFGYKYFQLMPQIAWKGKTRDHKKALKEVGHYVA